VRFAAIRLCVGSSMSDTKSKRVFPCDSVRKLLDTPSYNRKYNFERKVQNCKAD
jgi:hypothetical protein